MKSITKKKPKQIKKEPKIQLELVINQLPRNKFIILSLALIVLWGIIIYSSIFDNTTQFDDVLWLSQSAFHNFDNIDTLFQIGRFRIIPFLSLVFNTYCTPSTYWTYYLFNIIIHLINSILVFFLVQLLFKTPYLKTNDFKKYSRLFGLFAALIFLSHPLQTQAVTYIYQRLASIVTMFYLSSILFYINAKLVVPSKQKIIYYFLSFIFMIAGFFSKENAFTIPLMLGLIEILIFPKDKKRLYKIGALLLGVCIIALIVFYLVDGFQLLSAEKSTFNGERVNSFNYFITQISVVAKYIRLLFLPYNQVLDYYFPVVNSLLDFKTIIFALLHIGIIYFAFSYRKKNILVSFGIFWFYLTLSIESGIIPLEDLIFEHRCYLPMFGFTLFFISFLYQILWKKSSIAYQIIIILIILTLSVLTILRNQVWNNPTTLWTDVLKKSPEKARAYTFLAKQKILENKDDEAISIYTQAIITKPNFNNAYFGRAGLLIKQKKYNEALRDLSNCISLCPDSINYYSYRANIYFQIKDYNKAINDLNIVLSKRKNIEDYFNRASSYVFLNKYDEAIKDIQAMLALEKNNHKALISAARIYLKMQKYDNAINTCNKLIRINPKDSLANTLLADVYYNKGDYQEAINYYSILANQYPNNLFFLYSISDIYSITKQHPKAIAIYNKILKTNPNLFEVYHARADAYYALEQYRDALDDYKIAFRINNNDIQAKERINKIDSIIKFNI